jgi:uncharacterized protein (TIGR03382 family)
VSDGAEVDNGTNPLDPEDDVPEVVRTGQYLGGCSTTGDGSAPAAGLLLAAALLARRRK